LTTNALPFAGGNLSWWVAKTGNDNNAGTQSAPFLTIQRALNTAVGYDWGLNNFPTINVGDGIYSDPIVSPFFISGETDTSVAVKLMGNISSPGNVVLDMVSQSKWMFDLFGGLIFGGFEVRTSQGVFMANEANCYVTIAQPINVVVYPGGQSGGPVLFANINDLPYCSVTCFSKVTVSGTATPGDFDSFIQYTAPGCAGGQINFAGGQIVLNSALPLNAAFIAIAEYCICQLPSGNIVNPGNIRGLGVTMQEFCTFSSDCSPTTFPGGTVIDGTSAWQDTSKTNQNFFHVLQSGLPTVSDLSAGCFGTFKNPADGNVYSVCNDNGTIKKIQFS
jgi:hypothetical protein